MPTNDAAALEPCPNPECEWSDPQPEYHGRRVWCECQTCGTRAAYVEVESDSADDWTAADSEARRLWNRLPRAPRWTSEPPKVPGDYWVRITDPDGRVTAVYVSWLGECRMGIAAEPGTEYAPAPRPLEALR